MSQFNHGASETSAPSKSTAAAAADAASKVFEALNGLSTETSDAIKQQLQRAGANLELKVPSHQIGFGKLANRHKDAFRDEDFELLKTTIEATGGNEVAIVIRPVCGPDAFEKMNRGMLYEVVAGHRRLRACQALNIDVKAVLVAEMSDREAARLMHAENAARKDLSPYEAGAMYLNWLDQGLYKSQNELAKDNRLSPSEVSRAMAIARLPGAVVEALSSPRDIQYKDAEAIGRLLQLNERAVMAKAAALAAEERRVSRRQWLAELEAAVVQTDGIGSANAPLKQVIQVGENEICHVRWYPKGGGRIDLQHALNDTAKQKLAKMLATFFEKELRAPKAKASPASK